MFEKIHASGITEVFAYDSTKRYGGAPALPGCLRVVEDPTFGQQIYKLLFNESGGVISSVATGGKGLALAPGVLWAGPTVAATSVANTPPSKFGGVFVGGYAVPNNNWAWALVRGEALLSVLTLSVAGAPLETQAAGNFDDTTTAFPATIGLGPTLIGFQTGATVGGSTAATRVFVMGAQL